MNSLPLATLSAADRLSQIPAQFWWSVLISVAFLAVIVSLLRAISKMNHVVLAVVVMVFFVGLATHWVRERNEPRWARPAVSVVAAFMPAKVVVSPR